MGIDNPRSKPSSGDVHDDDFWPPVMYRFEYCAMFSAEREPLRRRTADRAKAAFLAGGTRGQHVLAVAGSEFHRGDTDYAADLLCGCIAAAGGFDTVAKFSGLNPKDLEEQLDIDETLRPDIAARLMYALARLPR